MLLRTCANLDLISPIYFCIKQSIRGNARSLSDSRCGDSLNFSRGNLAEKQAESLSGPFYVDPGFATGILMMAEAIWPKHGKGVCAFFH